MRVKSKFRLLTMVLLAIIISACTPMESTSTESDVGAFEKISYGPDYAIEWSDPGFEAAVRIALDKPSGTIMRSELDYVTHFEVWGDSFAIFNDSAPDKSSSWEEAYSLGTGGVFNTCNNIISLEDCRHFKALVSLKITNNNNLDISHLDKYAPKLNSLELLNNNIDNSEALSTLSSLTKLVLEDAGITDVNALGALRRLECLELDGWGLNDIIALQHLSRLKRLKINKQKLEFDPDSFEMDTEAELLDIRILSKLKQLEELSLSGEAFNNIDVVGKLSNLKQLELISVNGDISSIGKLSNLKILRLMYVNSDFNFLSKLHELEKLSLMGYSLPHLDPITSLSNLKRLAVYDTQITNLDALSNLGNLEELLISGAGSLHDINGISNLIKLKNLTFDYTNIVNINPLSNLANLQVLSITDTYNLENIEALSTLTNLKKLYLYSTKVSDISALRNLDQLTTLNIGFSPVSNIDVLENMNQLISLDISNTQVSNIDVLENMKQLQYLYIQNTHIKDTSVLSKLPLLKYVYPEEAMPIASSSKESSLQTSSELPYQIKSEYSVEDFLEQPLSKVVDLFGDNYRIFMGEGAPGLYYPKGEIGMQFYTGEDISDSSPRSFNKAVSVISVSEGQVIPGLYVGESADNISKKVNLIISTPEYDEYANTYYMVGIHQINGHDYALVFYFDSPTSQCESVFVKLAQEYGIPY